MFKKWKLRRIGFKLLGISADFERDETDYVEYDDASAAAAELRNAMETVMDSLAILEETALESEDDDVLDEILDQLDETEIWAEEVEELTEEIGETDNYAAADLFEQLANIYDYMADISEILAEKFEGK